ncbi:hypothetical protein [Bacillus cereus]|uniref:hypothetical protein n=1 Tax=Bacillus cereus TaxID=1396 RepID=UPI003EE0EF2B
MSKYLIPKARYTYKEFNGDKRNWSFKCDWYGEKVSSKTNEGYYSAYDCNFKGNSFNRGCSEDCAKLIWKDGFKHWAHEHGDSKFFEQIRKSPYQSIKISRGKHGYLCLLSLFGQKHLLKV